MKQQLNKWINTSKGGIFKFKKLWSFVLLGFILLLAGCDAVLLNPKGAVAAEQKDLLILSVLLMLIVVIPVFILTFVFAWKYRKGNKDAKYTPNWGHSTILEVIWWVVPCIIIGILAYLVWVTSHSLDPYKPIVVKEKSVAMHVLDTKDQKHKHIQVMAKDLDVKPVVIQVVALDWKWLFIYPEYNVATVNYIEFPAHVPLSFRITSDAPMNSFIIPALGGQIYAMEGMQTQLHLIADEEGTFDGRSANYSGSGFSGMTFKAKATSQEDFKSWVNKVRSSKNILSWNAYEKLVEKSENNPVTYYSSTEPHLFHKVIMKFMPTKVEKVNNSDQPAEI
ncbi:COX aromatic rich motif-containing protein [Francisellaceae bacterium]|nr:COX aromatic rich motif-containing protein [Francisellaceae bacterium]